MCLEIPSPDALASLAWSSSAHREHHHRPCRWSAAFLTVNSQSLFLGERSGASLIFSSRFPRAVFLLSRSRRPAPNRPPPAEHPREAVDNRGGQASRAEGRALGEGERSRERLPRLVRGGRRARGPSRRSQVPMIRSPNSRWRRMVLSVRPAPPLDRAFKKTCVALWFTRKSSPLQSVARHAFFASVDTARCWSFVRFPSHCKH